MEKTFSVYYFGARWVNPAFAAFISSDKSRVLGNSLEHYYTYTGGRPFSYVDPSGNTGKHIVTEQLLAEFSSAAGHRIDYLLVQTTPYQSFSDLALEYYGRRSHWRRLYLYNRARNASLRKKTFRKSTSMLPLTTVYLPSRKALLKAKMTDVKRVSLTFYQRHPADEALFRRQANPHARRIRSISFNWRNVGYQTRPRIRGIGYHTGQDIIQTVKAAYRYTGRKVSRIHIYGHASSGGVHGTTWDDRGLYSGGTSVSFDRTQGGRTLADFPVQAIAKNAVIVLHGCNTGFSPLSTSFAQDLFKKLYNAGLTEVKVYGRPYGGATGSRTGWVEFSRRHPTGKQRTRIPYY